MKLAYRTPKNAEMISNYYGKALDKPDWYEVKALSADQTEILIYDYIGWPFNDPYELVTHLSTIPESDLKVRIHSPGGDIFDGVALFNAFENHKGKVTTINEGLTASMATVIALAGKNRQAYSNSMFMYHNGWTVVGGNHHELREVADILEKINGNMIDIYSSKSNVGKRDMAAIMDAETYMTAKEAKAKGLIDTIIESGKIAKAKYDTSIFAGLPDGMFGDREGRELTEREAERALRDAGASRAYAKSVIAGRSQGGGTKEDGKNEAGKEDVAVCTYALNQIIRNIEGKK